MTPINWPQTLLTALIAAGIVLVALVLVGTVSMGIMMMSGGNIGIGGDPARLLRRCTDLLAGDATLIVELGAPGSGSWRRLVRLRHAGWHSPVFWWAAVAADDVQALADDAVCGCCAAGVRRAAGSPA